MTPEVMPKDVIEAMRQILAQRGSGVVCDKFMVARPDNPGAELLCFRCHFHRDLHK